jgi:hypothetical protein
MKKILILSSIAVSLFMASCTKEETKSSVIVPTDNSLMVSEKNMSLINKFTGTNCYYCGDWGWTLIEDLITAHKDDAVVVGAYSQNSFAQLFISPIATDWDKRLAVTQGYPTFAPNFVDSWLLPVKDDLENNIEATVTSHNNSPILVNTAHTFKIEGTNLIITSTTKFFKEATGEYQLGVYVMENKVIGNQSGPKGGPSASHHNVLRAGNTSWGEALANGTITANTKIDKTTTIVLDAKWKVADLEVFTVIWKKNGTKWNFVNAHK